MIDLFLQFAADPGIGPKLAGAITDLLKTAGQGDGELVERAELAIQADPAGAFVLDGAGFATLRVAENSWQAGRFETPSIGELRRRAEQPGGTKGKLRLWVLDGASPATDIGGLQATAPPDSLFQAASQFNCLESPRPYVTPVTQYFHDRTQGPRASISAFPGTLLRHYAAPRPDGSRFVQTDSEQLNILADAFGPEIARVESGYLMAQNVRDPRALIAAVMDNFDAIRVGVHEGVQVVLGYNFEGSVADSASRRISQVFTSTVAGGGYSRGGLTASQFEAVSQQLLRAAYLGTLLAAATLRQRRAVLTLIGGGVFGNSIPLIWDSILWAAGEVEGLLSTDLDVVVNGRNLGTEMARDALLSGVRRHDGAILAFEWGAALPTALR